MSCLCKLYSSWTKSFSRLISSHKILFLISFLHGMNYLFFSLNCQNDYLHLHLQMHDRRKKTCCWTLRWSCIFHQVRERGSPAQSKCKSILCLAWDDSKRWISNEDMAEWKVSSVCSEAYFGSHMQIFILEWNQWECQTLLSPILHQYQRLNHIRWRCLIL